jgi:hypothetical protein
MGQVNTECDRQNMVLIPRIPGFQNHFSLHLIMPIANAEGHTICQPFFWLAIYSKKILKKMV